MTKVYIVISYMHTECHLTEGAFSNRLNAEKAIITYVANSKLPASQFDILEREIDEVYNKH